MIIVTILQWHEYKMGFPKKINLCSTYVNKISLKYLKKYLPWNLLKLYFIGEYHCCIQFHFMEIRKSLYKEPRVYRCLLILDLKPFRLYVKGYHL